MSADALAWHFLPADRRLANGDGREVRVGETLRVEPPIALCDRGLHASVRAIDALGYAPGPVVCRVRLSGEILRGDDKLCATERTVLAMADATETMRGFVRWCMRSVAHFAAGYAVGDAAWAASRDAQNAELERRLGELMKATR